MSLLSVNSIDVLAPLDGHILVVGDIWLDHQQITSTAQALSFFRSGQNGALTLAITLQAAASACTLVSYVGDDSVGREITQTLAQCGVTADLLAIKNWMTYTSALDFSQKWISEGVSSGGIDRTMLRRHKDEKIIPIEGLSEYQAHLQNRTEKYLLNASALVLVDLDLGCIAEPRALNFAASRSAVPVIAMVNEQARNRYEGFEKIVLSTDSNCVAAVCELLPNLTSTMGEMQ